MHWRPVTRRYRRKVLPRCSIKSIRGAEEKNTRLADSCMRRMRAMIPNAMMKPLPLLAATVLATALSGCAGDGTSSFKQPFNSAGGVENGPSSSVWGDTASGPQGSSIGCIRGRRFAVLITVHNQTRKTIALLGAAGAQSFRDVIERVAVQVRLAPPGPTGGFVVTGLKSWNPRSSPPVLIPPGRDAWVQSNYSMRNCADLRGSEPATINRNTTLIYRADAGRHRQCQVPRHKSSSPGRPLGPRAATGHASGLQDRARQLDTGPPTAAPHRDTARCRTPCSPCS
jgi:hypothetical protein